MPRHEAGLSSKRKETRFQESGLTRNVAGAELPCCGWLWPSFPQKSRRLCWANKIGLHQVVRWTSRGMHAHACTLRQQADPKDKAGVLPAGMNRSPCKKEMDFSLLICVYTYTHEQLCILMLLLVQPQNHMHD
eukprot:1142488-Pelagomonas_calceolata.AAC.10